MNDTNDTLISNFNAATDMLLGILAGSIVLVAAVFGIAALTLVMFAAYQSMKLRFATFHDCRARGAPGAVKALLGAALEAVCAAGAFAVLCYIAYVAGNFINLF